MFGSRKEHSCLGQRVRCDERALVIGDVCVLLGVALVIYEGFIWLGLVGRIGPTTVYYPKYSILWEGILLSGRLGLGVSLLNFNQKTPKQANKDRGIARLFYKFEHREAVTIIITVLDFIRDKNKNKKFWWYTRKKILKKSEKRTWVKKSKNQPQWENRSSGLEKHFTNIEQLR